MGGAYGEEGLKSAKEVANTDTKVANTVVSNNLISLQQQRVGEVDFQYYIMNIIQLIHQQIRGQSMP